MSKMMTFIEEQPQALRRLLSASFPTAGIIEAYGARTISKIWILGSGTSLFAAMIAAEVWEVSLGVDAEAISSLEFNNSAASRTIGPHTMVVGISQSGATFVLVEAIRAARERGALTVGVTAESEALIGGAAEFIMPTFTGPEDAMGKTKGFSTTCLAACMLGSSLGGQNPNETMADVPDAVAAVIGMAKDSCDDWVARLLSCQALFSIGSGSLLPGAWEGGLKVLEVAKTVVVTKELEEMLHGPFNAVGPDAGFMLLAGQVDRPDRVTAFINGVHALDLPLVVIAERGVDGGIALPGAALILPLLRVPLLASLLAVVAMQVLAEGLATARQLDPDSARYPFMYKILGAKSIYV